MAKSELAGVTASMSVFSLVMNCMTMSLIWNSMSGGWSPTGTLVRPGRSTNVRLRTEGEREGERERERERERGRERRTSLYTSCNILPT